MRLRASTAAPLLIGLLLAGLGACAERGDFGRPRPTLLAQTIAPAVGTQAASWRGEPASGLALTDDEVELHRRGWRFLMPSESQDVFEQGIAEAVRTRILPAAAHPFDPDAYHAGLMAEPFRSPASRYRRLGEDAAADAALVAPFATLSLRVIEADRVRLAMLDRVGPPQPEGAEALARVAENRCLVAWVREAASRRALAYRIALDRLVIEAPQGEGIAAERALAALDASRRVLDAPPAPGAACSGGEGAVMRSPPRALQGAVVVKG